MNVTLGYLVLLVITVTSLGSAQTDDFGPGGSEIGCKCTPSCNPVGVSECNGRILPRSDCPCCNVCLRQKGESCEEYNAPCEKGLTCSADGKCQVEQSCKRDLECPDDRICIRNVCADPCPLLQPCLQSNLHGGVCVTRKHVAQCDCPKHHKLDRDLNICVSLQGCLDQERTIGFGEHFYKSDCSRVCFCNEDGFIRCHPIYCPDGLFPMGSTSKKDLCIELHVPNKTDDCCVVQACMNDGKSSNQILEKPVKIGKSLDVIPTELVAIESDKKKLTKRAAMRRTLSELQAELAGLSPDGVLEKPSNREGHSVSIGKAEEDPKPVGQFTIRILPRNSNPEYFQENLAKNSKKVGRSTNFDTLNHEASNMNMLNITVINGQSEKNSSGIVNVENAFSTNEEEHALASLSKNKKKSLQLLKTDHNSSLIILPTTKGGVLHYKESKSGGDFLRLTAKTGQKELLVDGLRPLTKYTLKWAGNDESDDKVQIETEDGCQRNIISYGVKEVWNVGCVEKCECFSGNKVECRPRCIFVKGSIQDIQCTEITSSSDPECCVEYACKNSSDSKIVDIPKTSKTMMGSLEAKLIVTSRTEDSISVAWENFREINPDEGYVAEYRRGMPTETTTWMRQEVPQGPLPPTMTIENLKPNSIYQIRVGLYKNSKDKELVANTETITVSTEKVDPCLKKDCGPNAHCRVSLTSAQQANCTCNDGFYFDSDINSCKLDENYTSEKNGCRFQGRKYSPGDNFYDGCMFKCTCDEQSEIDCQPRCPFTIDSKNTEDCRFFNDPDDKCCKLKVCNTTLESPNNSLQSSLNFDGCLYGNKTYKKNENFTIGCELKCLCMGFGDVSCYPRCPPVKDTSKAEGTNCATLNDPQDRCCSVTICDNSTSEVFKDNEMMAEDEIKMAGAEGKDINATNELDATTESSKTNESATIEHSSSNPNETTHTSILEIQNKMSSQSKDIKNTTMTDIGTAKQLFSHLNNEPSTTTIGEGSETTVPSTDVSLTNGISSIVNITENVDIRDESFTSTTTSSTDNTHMTSLSVSDDSNITDASIPDDDNSLSKLGTMPPVKNMSFLSTARNSPSVILSNVNVTLLPKLTTDATSSNVSKDNNKSMHERKLKLDDENIHENHLDILDVHKMDAETIQITVKVSHDIMAEFLSDVKKDPIIVSYSHDSTTWKNQSISTGGLEILSVNTVSFSVHILNGAVPNMLRIYYKDAISPIKISKMQQKDVSMMNPKTDFLKLANKCQYKGKTYAIGEDFYDACEKFCQCTEEAEVFCAPIQCPDQFGLDVMDPGCLKWKEDENYVPVPPRCCRRKPRCILRIEDFSCTVNGETFDHLDVLPLSYSKCDQRCQCMKGHIDCENLCSPVQATPPFDLPCHPTEATITMREGFPCCPEWQCSNDSRVDIYPPLPPGISHPELPTRPQKPVQRIFLPMTLDTSTSSVQFSFKIPRQFVGLPGGLYLRYTPSSSAQTNPLDWQSEVIHEEGLTLSGVDWVYRKTNLHPDTNYSMQVVLSSRLAKVEIVSPIFSVKTRGIATSPLPRLEVNAALKIGNIKNISCKVSWRQFTDYELKYIDGIGVRYWPDGKKFPLEGPMLHRKADNYVLKDLKPDTGYTVDLIFLTHDGYSTNIINTNNITFTTLPKPKDKYAFNITIKMGNITDKGVQVLYSGVTEPEGIYVNVFRVVYTTDGDLRDSHKFKVPKNQKEGFILLTDLKPSIAYEIWLEAYLTNGVKKKSNVITIHTNPAKLGKAGSIIDDGIQENEGTTYYAALIWVSVLAALICIAFILLVLYIWRRQNHAKAQISAKGSYDNPSYKGTGVGYGIEMNGMKSNGNGREEL